MAGSHSAGVTNDLSHIVIRTVITGDTMGSTL